MSDVAKLEPREETCERHGTYTSKPYVYGDGMTGCPVCDKEEHREREERRAEESREEHRRERVARNRANAGIPARFTRCTFANYVASSPEQQHALSTIQAYAERFKEAKAAGNNLVLIGNHGNGKTHLGGGALPNHLLDAGYEVIYIQLIELIRAIRATWRRDAEKSESEVIAKFRNIDLLILDEVGVSFNTENERNTLFDVLDGRYRDGRPTVLISNLNADALKQSLGERLYDRLVRENGNVVVVFSWKSYRPEVVPVAHKENPKERELTATERLQALRRRNGRE